MIRKLLIAVGLGVTLTVASAAPASAVNAFEWNTASGSWVPGTYIPSCIGTDEATPAAWVCFAPGGDKLFVSDQQPDGHSAAMYWRNFNSDGSLYRHGACYETRGNGSTGFCNKDFREGSKLEIQACTVEASTRSQYQCSAWNPAYA